MLEFVKKYPESEVKDMTELTNYEIQAIRTCIQTYFNLYGVMPKPGDMVEWLGEPYEKVIPLYISVAKAA